MPFDREIFFETVRNNPFTGSLTQQQVDGMEHKLDMLQVNFPGWTDLRWPAYAFATAMWETSSTMWPIEEYGKGGSADYAKKDPETGQTYYGRGDVQLTWRENYARADKELGLTGDQSCEWHAQNALDPDIAATVMYQGMEQGWFRSDSQGRQTLGRYFNDVTDDPYGAREIINGDKSKVPSWSSGAKVGDLIAGYHRAFLVAFEASWIEAAPEPEPGPEVMQVTFTITVTGVGPFTVAVEESDAIEVQGAEPSDAGGGEQSQGGRKGGYPTPGRSRVRSG